MRRWRRCTPWSLIGCRAVIQASLSNVRLTSLQCILMLGARSNIGVIISLVFTLPALLILSLQISTSATRRRGWRWSGRRQRAPRHWRWRAAATPLGSAHVRMIDGTGRAVRERLPLNKSNMSTELPTVQFTLSVQLTS